MHILGIVNPSHGRFHAHLVLAAAGEVELVNGIQAGSVVKLVPFVLPGHVDFLELVINAGGTSALIRTKKPLDADVLTNVRLVSGMDGRKQG